MPRNNTQLLLYHNPPSLLEDRNRYLLFGDAQLQVAITENFSSVFAKIKHGIQPCVHKGNMKAFEIIFAV